MGSSLRFRIKKNNKQSMQWNPGHPSEEIQEGAISREDDGFNFFGIVRG
jgi:hypothetical protein